MGWDTILFYKQFHFLIFLKVFLKRKYQVRNWFQYLIMYWCCDVNIIISINMLFLSWLMFFYFIMLVTPVKRYERETLRLTALFIKRVQFFNSKKVYYIFPVSINIVLVNIFNYLVILSIVSQIGLNIFYVSFFSRI